MRVEVKEGPVARVGDEARAGVAERRKVAVLVVHGMGQQAQYETLARAARGLAREVGADPDKVDVRSVATKEGEVRRAEVRAEGADVHVYEGYWAPHTEGNVTLRDVVSFLRRGAWSGLRNARKGYARYAFGRTHILPPSPRTMLTLGLAALVLASLTIVDLTAVAIAAAKGGLPEWLPMAVLTDATWLALVFALAALALPFYLGAAAKARRLRAAKPFVVLSWIVFGVALAALVACGVGIVGLAAYHFAKPAAWPSGPFATPPPTWLVVAMWGGLVAASVVLRGVFVQYVGDVAAYVSPQSLDRFSQMRKEIKASVRRVAVAIYEAKEYERVAIVGHSLGSVVAYDTLNGLLREDALAAEGEGRRVRERTPLLLTFGSPLDKTAFVFATAPRHASPTREALAALSQPLILGDEFRRGIRWVNVHSRADPVSGPLDLYGHVENKIDPDATTPLVAHNEYWENRLVWREVREALVGGRTLDVQGDAPTRAPFVERR